MVSQPARQAPSIGIFRMTACADEHNSFRAFDGKFGLVWPARCTLDSASTDINGGLLAPMAVFLCTDEAWNVNGKIFAVAGGSIALLQEELPARSIIKDGPWTFGELQELVPMRLMYGLPNPAPPPRDLEIPGRPAPAAAQR